MNTCNRLEHVLHHFSCMKMKQSLLPHESRRRWRRPTCSHTILYACGLSLFLVLGRLSFSPSLLRRGVARIPSKLRTSSSPRTTRCHGTLSAGDTVLVTGSTGGVGQLVVANLVAKGYNVKALTRSEEKGKQLFGDQPGLEVVTGDQRYPETLTNALDDVDAVVSCSGTTAFPSKRWDGDNGPEMTDKVGLQNIIKEAIKHKEHLKRFVLVSSTGVVRRKQFPFLIMDAFGVLEFKKQSEEFLEESGLPYTILRPGRLTDGPYTSYDLNTLLRATAGNRQNVEICREDCLNGEMSRVALAEAIVQAMKLTCTEGEVMSLMSRQGDGPGAETDKWESLYKNVLGE